MSLLNPNILDCITLPRVLQKWEGISLLFFLIIPNMVTRCSFSSSVASGTEVNQLSHVTFLPVFEIGFMSLNTTSFPLFPI